VALCLSCFYPWWANLIVSNDKIVQWGNLEMQTNCKDNTFVHENFAGFLLWRIIKQSALITILWKAVDMFARAPAPLSIFFFGFETLDWSTKGIHWSLRLIWLMALSDNLGKYHKIYYPVPMLHIAYSCVDINSSLWNMHWRAFPLVELVTPDKYIFACLSSVTWRYWPCPFLLPR